MQGRLQGAELL